MLALLIAVTVSQTPSAADRLRPTEVSVGLTGVGSAYNFRGGRLGDFTLGPDIRAHAVLAGFTVAGSFLHAVPFDSGGVATATTLTARVGYTGERFQLLAGAVIQVAPEVEPARQLLPSLRAEMKFTEKARFSFSLFEAHGLVPVQFAWEQQSFFIGYVAPIGLSAGFRMAASQDLSLDVRGVAFSIYNTQVAMLTVSGVVGGAR